MPLSERSQREEDAASALVEEEQVRADVASASPGVDAESDFCLPNQSAPPQVAAAARSVEAKFNWMSVLLVL